MCVHTREGGGLQQATSQETASSPTTPPVCHQQGPSPPSLSPACLAPAPPVTHPAHHLPSPSPAPPVTHPACHWSCLTGIWVGTEDGEEKTTGVWSWGLQRPCRTPTSAQHPAALPWQPLRRNHFPKHPPPPQALLLAELRLRRA